jgi:hypothetical protein
MSLLFHPDLLQVEVAGDVTVIKLTSARFEDGNAGSIGQQLSDLVDRLGRHKLHLDLGQVEFLSSMGLAKLIALNQKVRAAGGRVPPVQRPAGRVPGLRGHAPDQAAGHPPRIAFDHRRSRDARLGATGSPGPGAQPTGGPSVQPGCRGAASAGLPLVDEEAIKAGLGII